MVQHAGAGDDPRVEAGGTGDAAPQRARPQALLQGRRQGRKGDARVLPSTSAPLLGLADPHQLGHILPSTTSASNAVASIPRKRTFIEELVDDEQAKAYAKKKFVSEVMVRGMSGRGRSKKGGRGKGRGGKGRA